MKQVLKIVFILNMLLPIISNAQAVGKMEINLDCDGESSYTNAYLLLEDSLIKSFKIEYAGNKWELDSLVEGTYVLQVRKKQETIATFNALVVKPGCKVTYEFKISDNVYCEEDWELTDSLNDKSEALISLLYGNQKMSPKPSATYNEMLSASFCNNFIMNSTKYFSPSALVGAKFSYTDFTNDTSSFGGNKLKSKRYMYLAGSIGFMGRISSFNLKKYSAHHSGLYIDLGIIYNIPLVCRQVEVLSDKSRVQTKYIHKFTDFTFTGRLVYKFVGVQVEYNISNYLMKPYVSNPFLRVGLTFSVPQ